ncbi:MAG: TIGR00730 family Rossman fold protein [Bacteroidota bacterium]
MRKTVCIFCGANTGTSPEIIKQAEQLSDLLIQKGYSLIYGGGKDGLMGIIANKFIAAEKEVIGIRPDKLIKDENVHSVITQLIVVKDMHERKAKMIEMSDIFIALPGGIGTLDEIIEVYTQTKIGFISKFCGILNTNDFYEGLEILLHKMVKFSFLKEEDKKALYLAKTPEALVNKILNYESIKKEIDKIAYIKIKDGRILCAKSKGKHKFYLPGGKREEGETDEATLIRESEEELSIHIVPSTITYMGTFIAQADGKPKGVLVKMTCYSAQYKGTITACSEIDEIKWLNYKDIDLVSEVDKKIFKFLKEEGVLT